MPKQPQDQAQSSQEIDLDRVAEASQKSLLAFAHLHSRLMRNALEVNAEILDFARKRIGEDILTNERLTRCGNVNEAMEVMSGFYQKAFEAYAEEANNLVRISAEATKRSLEDSRREGEEALADAGRRGRG